jgi:hypothetical protein
MRVKVPKGSKSFSHAGVTYTADEGGFAEIPSEAFAELKHHGIEHAPEEEITSDTAAAKAKPKLNK